MGMGKILTNVAKVLGSLIALVGLGLVIIQINQANELRRWANYNEMNLRYSELISEIPYELTKAKSRDFENYSEDVKIWVRKYFNLYSEEYFLFKENLIPEEMWTERIANGVDVNLRKYPLLIDGYEYWKSQGAHNHPKDFRAMVDEKIESLLIRHPEIREKLNQGPKKYFGK